MDTAFIMTSLTPAIMLFLVAMALRFFPPSREGSSVVMSAPEWWRRDAKTWERASGFLAKRYLVFSLILAGLCAALLFLELTYGAAIGYILLVVFFIAGQLQVRQFMKAKVK